MRRSYLSDVRRRRVVTACFNFFGYVSEKKALPDVPAVLITSVQARAGSDFFQETPEVIKLKRQRHAAFLSQFFSGAHVFTPNSGHGIQRQEPELVIAAIEQVNAGHKGRGAPGRC